MSLLKSLLAALLLVAGAAAQVDPFPDAIPGFGDQAEEKLQIEPLWSQSAVRPGERLVLALRATLEPGWFVKPTRSQLAPGDEDSIPTEVRVTKAPDWVTTETVTPPQPAPIDYSAAVFGKIVDGFEGQVVFFLPLRVSEAAEPGSKLELEVSIRYSACNDRICIDPVTALATASIDAVAPGTAVEPTPAEVFEEFAAAAAAAGRIKFDLFGLEFEIDTGSGLGFVLLLLVAMLGGFLLNFTPCVLPVIPIKIMSLSKSAGNRGRTIALGTAMSFGVVFFWLGLGALIGGLAKLLFGVEDFTATNQLFQYPAVTIGIGVLIAALAVGMCGLFSIQLPGWLMSVSPRDDTMAGQFGLGIMTAVLSTPCTAPFMGAAAAWAATQSPATTLVTFAAIGLGMALPYQVLSVFPAMARRMPRSGAAAELIKQVMGVFLLAAAAYFIGTGLSGLLVRPPDPPSKLHWWIVMGLCAGAGLWMAVRTWRIAQSAAKRVVFGALGLLIAVGSVAGGFSLTSKGPIDWVYYTEERFAQALADDKAVLMDFTAEWCLNCKALEHSVLYSDEVAARIAEDWVVPIKVDLTGNNPEGNKRLTEAGRRSIPLLVIYGRGGKEIWKSDAYTREQVLEKLALAANGTNQ